MKPPRLRILIVSEGAKTEGIYFSLFVRRLRATNVRVDILGRECGSDPLSVVEFARDRYLGDKGYDLCYCVIDRDSHPAKRFHAALQLAKSINDRSSKRQFEAVVSDPCVEFWFILHFVYWRAPFGAHGRKSRADAVVHKLRDFLPEYDKVNPAELSQLLPLTDVAIRNSVRAWADAQATHEPNPSTRLHEVASRLLAEAAKK